jgi:branched-chain amino acid transport system permease protein
VFGPLIGALALHFLGEFARAVAGRVPGVDLALFGILLILVIALARDGLIGTLRRWQGRFA